VTRLERVYPDHEVQLTDSGTSALMLALQLSVRAGSSRRMVALPAYACPDVATAAIGADFEIMLYDVDPADFEPDLASVEECLKAGASHLVAVHLYGRIVDVASLKEMAARYGATVVEDAAQHAGGTRNEVRGGALAPLSVLSFGRGKGLNAGGGGALLRQRTAGSSSEELRLGPSALPSLGSTASLRQLGIAVVADLLANPVVYAIPARLPALDIGSTRYHAPKPIFAMPQASAALLVDALDAEATVIDARQRHEQAYRDALEIVPRRLYEQPPPTVRSGALRVPVRLSSGTSNAVQQELSRLGVVRSYPRDLSEYPEVRPHLIAPLRPLTGAKQLAHSTYTLPTHSRITTAIRHQIIELVTRSE
jgi:dTDP-4-amino-4,6-dideoxygalactose transaminase